MNLKAIAVNFKENQNFGFQYKGWLNNYEII